jgi:hypothetical protein
MLWSTRGSILTVSSILAICVAAPFAGAEQVPIELYKEPHPKFLEVPSCNGTGSHIGDPTTCNVLYSGMGGWADVNFMIDPGGKPFEITVTRSTGSARDITSHSPSMRNCSTRSPARTVTARSR